MKRIHLTRWVFLCFVLSVSLAGCNNLPGASQLGGSVRFEEGGVVAFSFGVATDEFSSQEYESIAFEIRRKGEGLGSSFGFLQTNRCRVGKNCFSYSVENPIGKQSYQAIPVISVLQPGEYWVRRVLVGVRGGRIEIDVPDGTSFAVQAGKLSYLGTWNVVGHDLGRRTVFGGVLKDLVLIKKTEIERDVTAFASVDSRLSSMSVVAYSILPDGIR